MSVCLIGRATLFLMKQVCVQPRTSALNMALPAPDIDLKAAAIDETTLSEEVLARLSAWSEVQIVCLWSS